MFIDGLVVVVSPLILLTLTKRTADLLWISVILNSLAFVMFLVFRIPESIKFLLEKKRWARVKIEMKKIKFLGSIGNEKYLALLELVDMYQRQVDEKDRMLPLATINNMDMTNQ